ncbi:CPXCG motif-containing cysteine-rich protein [Aureibaculum marinum]|uniref:CPXCG motif-containing cysteine-rich protein n=1 Tax=Aureibaculum marinum TaxID=2487930 RepID=A0A3N4NT15_9FLAO|nr:CPXCG motif-containing cysteine-rich protein [Aureibaculum marinum]RPD98875.1 CPXCG motif-containing cysteine-rich protein [Aureibaculum marinum]
MLEYFFQCPYCWEEISMLLDTSILNTTYIEDCEVCCSPIELNVSFDNNQNLESFSAISLEQ